MKGLTGPLMVFSLGASYVLFPTVQVNGWSAIRCRNPKLATAGTATGTGRVVGTNVALPWGFTVGVSAEFRWTDYENGWFPFIAGQLRPRGPNPHPAGHAPEPRADGVRLQPPGRVFQPSCATPTRNSSTSNATSWKCAGSGSSEIGAVPPL